MYRWSSETHLVSSSTGPFIFCMPDLSKVVPSFNVGFGVDPGTTPGGSSIPFHVDRFGSGHIAPSYPLARPNTSVPIRRNDPRHVNI